MNRLTAFLTAIVAVVLMAGTSFAAGIDHGSWDEYTAMTNGTVSTDTNLAGVNVATGGGDNYITLNYETGEVNYGTVEGIRGTTGFAGVTEEHYGVAPAWSTGTTAKDYEVTHEMDMFF